MTDQQRNASDASSWDGFLPENALIMGRQPEAAVSSEVAEDPAFFIEGSAHSKLVFLSEQELDHQTEPLFSRMLAALGLSQQQIFLITLLPGAQSETQQQMLQSELMQAAPKAIVTLGLEPVKWLQLTQQPVIGKKLTLKLHESVIVLPTHRLASLLADPAAKKQTWHDLQEAAAIVGIDLPKRPS